MYHFFTDGTLLENAEISISGADHNHIKNVLRMRIGDTVVVTGGDGSPFFCRITSFESASTYLKVLGPAPETELSAEITLYQGFPKGDKLESIIQKSVELGAARIVPVLMERCVARPDPGKIASRLKRWQSIAQSAAEQSGRSVVPEVLPAMPYRDALDDAAGSLIVVPYEKADGMDSLAEVAANMGKTARLSVFIGPEGGFSENEIAMARSAGAVEVSLGRRILRTETAGPALIAFLMLTDEINHRG